MPMRITTRHVSIHRRLAVRRITRAMTAPTTSGVSAVFSASCVAISVTAHALATWFAIFVPQPALPLAKDDPFVATRFLYPLMQPAPRPVQEHISYVGLLGTGAPAPAAPRKPVRSEGPVLEEEVAIAPTPDEPVGEPDAIFSEIDVDLAAERDPNSEGPTYPDSLLKAQVEGEARVRFVVDSSGHADVASFGVIEADQLAFAEAVRLALPRMKFRPASIGEKRVPQHVEQTFIFKISRTPIVP
jgi:TonB family protein